MALDTFIHAIGLNKMILIRDGKIRIGYCVIASAFIQNEPTYVHLINTAVPIAICTYFSLKEMKYFIAVQEETEHSNRYGSNIRFTKATFQSKIIASENCLKLRKKIVNFYANLVRQTK